MISRRAQRHLAVVLVVPPNRVVARGAHLLDELLVQQALEHVAGGVALELRGDRKHATVLALACGGEDDELSIGKLCHGGGSLQTSRDHRGPSTTPSPGCLLQRGAAVSSFLDGVTQGAALKRSQVNNRSV